MGAVDLGQKATVKWATAPATGAYALAVTKPDGTVLSPAPTPTGTGTAVQADFVPPMAGRYLLAWSVPGAAAYTDVLDVWPADPRFLISLDDAQNGLGFRGRATADDVADLRLYVAAATPVIEDITGPVVPGQRTWTGTSGGYSVVLPDEVRTVVSVTVEGTALAAGTWWSEHGVLYGGTRVARAVLPLGEAVVVYTVGSGEIPQNIRLAARELVRHWWQIGMQATGGGSRPEAPGGEVFTPSGFAVPRRVIELCAPDQRVGGFA